MTKKTPKLRNSNKLEAIHRLIGKEKRWERTMHRVTGQKWWRVTLIGAKNLREKSKMDGPETWWYDNGKKEIETMWRNELKYGVRTWWYEGGRKKMEAYYTQGKECARLLWNEEGNVTAAVFPNPNQNPYLESTQNLEPKFHAPQK